MAIPFNLPSDEETEDTYRRIDQLLLDLYDLLRQIIFRRRIVRTESNSSEMRTPSGVAAEPQIVVEPTATAIVESRLPDVVVDSLPLVRKSGPRPPRRRRRRPEKPSRRFQRVHSTPYDDVRFLDDNRHDQIRTPPTTTTTTTIDDTSSSSWLNVGIELRQIAEEITFVSRNGNSSATKKRQELKASSLFSLLVPASISGTVWTTVAILVGWRLLAKHRSAV